MESRKSVSSSTASSMVVAQRWNSGSPRSVSVPPFKSITHSAQQAVADHRSGRAQRVPQQRRLARARRADHEQALAAQVEQERGAVLGVADVEPGQVDLGGGVGDQGRVEGVRERHAPLHHQGEHAGAAAGDGDPMRLQGFGEGGGAVGPGLQVLPADQPDGEGVDRRGDRPDPQHAGAEGGAGAAVVAGELAVIEQALPAPAAVDRPPPPPRPDAGRGEPVERRRMPAPPAEQPRHQHGDGRRRPGGRPTTPTASDQRGRDEGDQRVAGQPHQDADLPPGRAGRRPRAVRPGR